MDYMELENHWKKLIGKYRDSGYESLTPEGV